MKMVSPINCVNFKPYVVLFDKPLRKKLGKKPRLFYKFMQNP